MASVIDIVMGLNHEAVDSGIDHVKEQVNELETSFKQGLQAFLSVEAIKSLGEATLEYGAKVKNLSEQYGISTDKLQETSNAAKLHDVDMEAVAAAYNKLIINQQKAIEGGTAQQEAFQRMGISVDELVKTKPEELFDRVADATKNATDRGEAYGNVVAVMGKSAGSLMTTLEQGSAAIKEQGQAMGVLKGDIIDSLDEANRHIKTFEQQITATLGTLISWASRMASATALPFTAAIGAGAAALEALRGHTARAKEILDNLMKTVKDTQEYNLTGKDPNAKDETGPAIDRDREGDVKAADAAKKKADEAHQKTVEKIAQIARESDETQQQALLDQLPLYERIEAVTQRIAILKLGAESTPDFDPKKLQQLEQMEKMQRQLASLQGEATRKGLEDGKKAGDEATKAFERMHARELEVAKELSIKQVEYAQRLQEREKRLDEERFENRFRALKTESQQKEALAARQKTLEAELAKIPKMMAQDVFDKLDEIEAVKTRIADLNAHNSGGLSFKSDSLARIGGGGNVAGVSTMEKQLSEARAQTALLQKIANNGAVNGGQGTQLPP